MSNSRDIADSAATINFIDTVTSNVQTQLNTLNTAIGNISVTSGTLTQTFASGQTSTISLTSSVLAPVVTVTKEVSQSGSTNNTWDVNSTSQNYTRLDSAPATTLNWASDLASASYSQAFSVSSQDAAPQGLVFNADGTKMFVVGGAGQDINEYALTTGFDVSTASFTDAFSVSAQDTAPTAIAFNVDGTKMFVTGNTGNDVNEYTLSGGFDVSTASFVDSFSVAGQETSPYGLAFNTTGTKMFVCGNASDNVNEYALTTGFDVSTASFTDAFSVAGQDTAPLGLAFNAAGTQMFVLGQAGKDINRYNLSTSFDVSTASFVDSFSVSSQETYPVGLAFSSSGAKMFVTGSGNGVNQYAMPLTLGLGSGSFATADVGKTIEANSGVFLLTATTGTYSQTTAPTSYAQVPSGSWGMFGTVYNTTDGDLELSSATGAGYDLAAAAYTGDVIYANLLKGVVFNNDGTKMFTLQVGNGIGNVNEYTLSTAYLPSSATYVSSFNVLSQDTTPSGLAFNTDGTKMFVLGTTNDSIYLYNLSTAFLVSTAVYSSLNNFGNTIGNPRGLSFSPDGTSVYMIDHFGYATSFPLSTGFDISTIGGTNSNVFVGTDSMAVVLSSDGLKLFLVSTSGGVQEFTLPTAFSLTSASFARSLSISGEAGSNVSGITFTPDGSKFIVSSSVSGIWLYTSQLIFIASGYQPVHTTNSTDSTYWTDINSMTANQAAGDGNVYYAISTDDRTTWGIVDNTNGERDIVRNNGGTWQYNSNGTYASETWTAGTTNTELATLAQAMEGASSDVGYAPVNQFSYASKSFLATGQGTAMFSIVLKTDGTKMYLMDRTNVIIYQYSLSTAYDVSTASYDSVSFSVTTQENSPYGITASADGTQFYVVGETNDTVYQYTLSTAWDLSTASYASKSFSVAAQEIIPTSLQFKPDGTKVYVAGRSSDTVYQYTLSTAWDISTASYDSKSLVVSSQSLYPVGIALNPDGTRLYVNDLVNNSVYQYTLSTAWDLSTGTYDSLSFSLASQATSAKDFWFADSGKKMYSVNNNTVYQYATASSTYTNQMDKTQLDAVTDPNHIVLGSNLDLSIILNLTSGTTAPSSNGVSINYDANVLNKAAVLGTDYDFDAPAQNKVRITALAANNLKIRVL